MNGTLIYIGGSLLQLPSIAAAKAVGLRIVVTDSNPNAPGAALADGYEKISGDDDGAILDLGREIDRTDRLAGCYCGSDFGLMSVATVGAALGTPSPTPENVARALDKYATVCALREHGIRVPNGEHAKNQQELLRAAEIAGFPLIIKPVGSSGSRGVRNVTNADELVLAYRDALAFSPSVMVEEVVSGDHIDVNAVFVDGVFHPCGLLSRFFSAHPFNYPIWGTEPCHLPAEKCHEIYRVVEAASRALGLVAGPVKADVIVSSAGPVILEIAPRFHGDVSTSFVTPLATGSSGPRAWFTHLAGQPFGQVVPQDGARTPAGWMGIFPKTPGVFQEIVGTEAAAQMPGIKQVMAIKKPGYRVESISDNLAVMGFIWAVGRDTREVHENLARARMKIRVQMLV